MGVTAFSGPVRSLLKETDGGSFIEARRFSLDVGTWTATRGAAGNYFMRKTAAAETSNPSVNLSTLLFSKIGSDPQSGPHPTHDIRGVQITAIDVIYAIGTAALTTHSYDIHDTVYANNAAPAVTSTIGGTLSGTLATATQAQPYLSTITPGTPFILGANTTRRTTFLELTVVAAATSVYDLYGIFVRFNYNLL